MLSHHEEVLPLFRVFEESLNQLKKVNHCILCFWSFYLQHRYVLSWLKIKHKCTEYEGSIYVIDTYIYQGGVWWFDLVQVRQDRLRLHELFSSAQLNNILLRRSSVHSSVHQSNCLWGLPSNGLLFKKWLMLVLTLALNPRFSWVLCLEISSSGTMSITNETNSATFQ